MNAAATSRSMLTSWTGPVSSHPRCPVSFAPFLRSEESRGEVHRVVVWKGVAPPDADVLSPSRTVVPRSRPVVGYLGAAPIPTLPVEVAERDVLGARPDVPLPERPTQPSQRSGGTTYSENVASRLWKFSAWRGPSPRPYWWNRPATPAAARPDTRTRSRRLPRWSAAARRPRRGRRAGARARRQMTPPRGPLLLGAGRA
jgi:hypothetical protein